MANKNRKMCKLCTKMINNSDYFYCQSCIVRKSKYTYPTGEVTFGKDGKIYTSNRSEFLGESVVNNTIDKTESYHVSQDILEKAEEIESYEEQCNREYENKVVNDGLVILHNSIIEHQGETALAQKSRRMKEIPDELKVYARYAGKGKWGKKKISGSY